MRRYRITQGIIGVILYSAFLHAAIRIQTSVRSTDAVTMIHELRVFPYTLSSMVFIIVSGGSTYGCLRIWLVFVFGVQRGRPQIRSWVL